MPRGGVRVPELDGIRGAAIIAVVVAHYFGEVPHGVRALTAGWLGVELFFVLSGFLIGGILIDNKSSERLFSTFYVRRAFRIVPIYYVVLTGALLLLHCFGEAHRTWASSSLAPAAYYTYTQNIVMAVSGAQDGFWLLPTWTLAVEEQFYLILPLIIAFTPANAAPRIAGAAILSGPVLRAAALALGPQHAIAAYTLLICRWDALFLGVLAAYAYRDGRILEYLRRKDRLQWICLGAAWAVVATSAVDRFRGTALFPTLGFFFAALCFASLLLLAVTGAPMRRYFVSVTLRRIGTISYGLYLVHQPLLGLTHGVFLNARPDIGTPVQLAVTVLAGALSLGVAALSWRFFESPLIAFGHRWDYRRRELRAAHESAA